LSHSLKLEAVIAGFSDVACADIGINANSAAASSAINLFIFHTLRFFIY
jgi:hypothetical protein